jgi:hypothetical protein
MSKTHDLSLSQRASLKDYALFSRLAIEELAGEGMPPRRCRMTFVPAGEAKMNDPYRRVKMNPEDKALCVANFSEHDFTPIMFDHGWGSRGTQGGGEIIELPTEPLDLVTLCALTPLAHQEALVDRSWLGRSAGIRGYTDSEGFIHPVDIFEGSFTNLPAVGGLGGVEEMATFMQRFSGRSSVFIHAPEMTPSTTTPPEAAEQEMEMKFSADDIKRLGLPESASQEAAEAAFAALLVPKVAPPKQPTAAELTHDLTAAINSAAQSIVATGAKRDRIKSAIDAAVLATRIEETDRADYQSLGESNVELLEKTLAKLPARRPSGTATFRRNASDAKSLGKPTDDEGDAEDEAKEAKAVLKEACSNTTKILRFARTNRMEFDQAKAVIAAQAQAQA